MTNQPDPTAVEGSIPGTAPRPPNRLAVFLALGLLVAALAVGGAVWMQGRREDAAYKARAAAFHAALSKVRADVEAGQPPDLVTRDWEDARIKEKEWDDKLRDADEKKDLTDHLRTASIMFGNAVVAHQKAHAGAAETQPSAARATAQDLPLLMQNGGLALDLAAQDLKK